MSRIDQDCGGEGARRAALGSPGDIISTLNERGSRYGPFDGHARLTQALKDLAPIWYYLPQLLPEDKGILLTVRQGARTSVAVWSRAAGLRNVNSSREIMKESIEESGVAVAHDLSRYLTTLGTIASISPLMGLFGTVIGMIEISRIVLP